ncbi:MAG: aminoglycoside phosphotransferase family protein [Pseudonocardiales bacterium]|nr:aminoglycoside phosphotransferase family protein [Pseudonocardiales bacterium]
MSHGKGDDLAESAPLTASTAWEVLWAACPVAELNGDHARLIRFGENALFHLPEDDIVVRIARGMDYWADAIKEVDVARWLATIHFPAAQVYDVRQPVSIGGRPVTFWCFIAGRPGDRRDIATLGAILRRLHSTPHPATFLLPHESILGRVQQRIDAARVSLTDKSFLMRRLSDLQTDLSSLRFPLQPAPTHGDAHTENLIILPNGRPVLLDFERFAWGQPEWDLAMTATEYLTAKWWTDEEYRLFVDAYGYDVTSWKEGFDVLRAAHELKMTTWLMQNVAESPEIAEEYQVRMRTLRGEPPSGWRPF